MLIPYQVGPFTEEAALMPILTASFILVLSIILTIQSLNFKESVKGKTSSHKLPGSDLLAVMAIMIAYSYLLNSTGFVLTSAIGMFALFSVFKVRNLRQITIITGITLGILYISFEKFLYSPLPVGTIIEKILD